MALVGPLTTTFSAPASCTTSLYKVWTQDVRYYLVQGPLASDTNCYPSGYDAHPNQYYSPGFCPSGYTPACTSVVSINSVTDTRYTCCPTGSFQFSCLSSINPKYQWQSTLGCIQQFTGNVTMTSVAEVSDGATTIAPSVTESSGGAIAAYAVQVRFQSTDFATITEASTASSGTNGIAQPTSTTTDSAASNQSSGGISNGAVAGISVGAVLGTLLLVGGVAAFILLRRRRKKQSEEPKDPEVEIRYINTLYELQEDDVKRTLPELSHDEAERALPELSQDEAARRYHELP